MSTPPLFDNFSCLSELPSDIPLLLFGCRCRFLLSSDHVTDYLTGAMPRWRWKCAPAKEYLTISAFEGIVLLLRPIDIGQAALKRPVLALGVKVVKRCIIGVCCDLTDVHLHLYPASVVDCLRHNMMSGRVLTGIAATVVA